MSSDGGNQTQHKVKNSQLGENEPMEAPRLGRGRTQEKVLGTAEVQEESCESSSRQRTEPHMACMEFGELTEGHGAACSNPSLLDTEGEKASFSLYSRSYPRSGLLLEHTGEKWNEGPALGERIQPNTVLEKRHSGQMKGGNYDFLECGKSLHSNSLTKHPAIHTGENPHRCPKCGKTFSCRSNLLKHQKTHTRLKRLKCLECGKCFRDRTDLMRHQTIHTGKKPFQCPECGRSFSRKSGLLRHEKEQKPHKCSDCGKTERVC